jgi:segregation and condensation protein B
MDAPNTLKNVVEALLFAADKPVTAEQLRRALDTATLNEVRAAIESLRVEYAQAERGFAVVEIAGGYQMIANPSYSSFLKKLFKERQGERLSKPALETLAIIAYRQPLTKAEIQSLRNVNVDGIMKSLTDKALVKICGRKKVPGRPFVFGTTRLFLEHFGLNALTDLPKLEDLKLPPMEFEKAEVEPLTPTEQEIQSGQPCADQTQLPAEEPSNAQEPAQ